MYGNQVPAYFCYLLCTLVCTRVHIPLDSWPLLGRASVYLFILCLVHLQHISSQATQARKQLSATEHLPVAKRMSSNCRPSSLHNEILTNTTSTLPHSLTTFHPRPPHMHTLTHTYTHTHTNQNIHHTRTCIGTRMCR